MNNTFFFRKKILFSVLMQTAVQYRKSRAVLFNEWSTTWTWNSTMMVKKLLMFLLHHFFSKGTTERRTVGRENELVNIECATNITNITSASYHRISNCDICTSKDVVSVIRDLCIGNRSCSIPVSRDVFGDHCAGESHLYFEFYCQGKRYT